MIPLMDLLIKNKVEEKIEDLRLNPEKIEQYFRYASDKTLGSIKKLITDYKIHILNGYPREETQLPCIIISIANETEEIYGLGDGVDDNYPEMGMGYDNYLRWPDGHTKYIQENAQFNTTLRVEVWADNSTITSFLYAIVKYCLLSSKRSLSDKNGLYNISLMGGDLEPAPEYFPIFVYRRAVMFTFSHDVSYPVEDQVIGREDDHFPVGTTIDDIIITPKGYVTDGEKDN